MPSTPAHPLLPTTLRDALDKLFQLYTLSMTLWRIRRFLLTVPFPEQSMDAAGTVSQFRIVFAWNVSLSVAPTFTALSRCRPSLPYWSYRNYYYGAYSSGLHRVTTSLLGSYVPRLPRGLTRSPRLLVQMLPMPKHLCSVPLRHSVLSPQLAFRWMESG
jgi:hypothetical protein